MYSEGFFIKNKIGNNAFSFEKRKNKKLWIPKLVSINNINKIELQKDKEKIAFEDYDFDGNLSTNYGLKNFYELDFKDKKIFIFDNHNHALYFWYLAKSNNLINKKNNILFHIDEHSDYRDPGEELKKIDLKNIFNYTNFSKINVGNYIIPAEKEGLIGKTIQIRNSFNLIEFLEKKYINYFKQKIILNLDLDFFEEKLDFIDISLKIEVIKEIFKKASLVTIATSPFFIDQKLALQRLKQILNIL